MTKETLAIYHAINARCDSLWQHKLEIIDKFIDEEHGEHVLTDFTILVDRVNELDEERHGLLLCRDFLRDL